MRRETVTLAGTGVDLGEDFSVAEARLSKLCQYHLHYMEYLRDLSVVHLSGGGEEADRELAHKWVHGWIEENPPRTGVAWDPYPVAARLIHWAIAASAFEWGDEALRSSYHLQARYLERNLEYDLLGNHLLKEVLSLCVAEALLGEPVRSLGLLEQQLNEQILGDGGHYERSPMYHALLLEDCLTAYAVLPGRPAFLKKCIEKMTTYLTNVTHPDGEIPLFGDAAFGMSKKPAVLLAVVQQMDCAPMPATQAASFALPDSGFYILAPPHPGTCLIMKAGVPGPPYQLGHAHADMLSYEVSVEGLRFIVDSGVHGYAGSPYRAYCRSTRAHNTVSINHGEQLEAWSNFRVGRRYTPRVDCWRVAGDCALLKAGHDGFRPFAHERQVRLWPQGFWTVMDSVSGPGPCNAESFVHFHPEAVVERSEPPEGNTFAVARDGKAMLVLFSQGVEIEVVKGASLPEQQGWYCPEFGTALPAATLVARVRAASSTRMVYAIVPFTPSTAELEIIAAAILHPEA